MALKATKTPTKKKPAPKKKAAPPKKKPVQAAATVTEIETAPAPTPAPNDGALEISCLNAAVAAMDEAVNCHGAIPMKRRDPELKRVISEYVNARPAIMERLARIIETKG